MRHGQAPAVAESAGLLRRILAGIGALLAGNAAATVVAMLSSMVLARYLGVADYGRYSLVFLYATLFQGFASFGLDDILTRELSRGRHAVERLLGNAVALRLLLSAVAVSAAAGLAHLGERDPSVAWGTVLAVLPLLLSAWYVPLWSLLAARMEYPLREAIVVGSRVAELVLVVTCAALGVGFLALVGVTALAQTVPLALTFWSLRHRVQLRLRWDRETTRDLLVQAAPLGLASVVALVYGRADGVLLARLAGYEAVGLYSAAYKFLNLSLTLPYVVNAAVFPVMARVDEDRPTVQVVFQRAFDYLTLAALPIGIAGTILGPSLVALVYGAGFEGAAAALRVLLWSAGLMFAARTCRQLLIAGGQQAAHLGLLVGGVVLNVALNLWWIPRWGIVGAAWATLCAEAAVLGASYCVVRRKLGLGLQWGFAARAVVAAGAMGAVTAAAAALGPWLSLVAGGGAYLAVTAVLGLWPREPAMLLRGTGVRVEVS